MAAAVKRLLAVSWAMPPAVFPRSLQVSRSLHALAGMNWHITVICSEPPSGSTIDPELEKKYRNSYRTIRLPPDAAPRRKLFWQQSKYQGVAEAEIGWIDDAISMASKVAQQTRFDALATFAQPWSDHLIGLGLKSKLGLPWLAHFSDPWADNPYLAASTPKVRGKMQKAERRVIFTADRIVFTNSRTVDLVMRKYPPELMKNVSVVPHGYESRIPEIGNAGFRDRMRLVHTGDLYGLRSPDVFLRALAKLAAHRDLNDKMEVVFVGSVPETAQKLADDLGISSLVKFMGRLTSSEASETAASADVLLVIDAPSDNSVFLPSKLIDYLAFNRPVFGLTPKHGAAADLLFSLGCPTVPPDDEAAVVAVLEQLFAQWTEGTLSSSRILSEAAQRYRIDETTLGLDAALNAAIGQRK